MASKNWVNIGSMLAYESGHKTVAVLAVLLPGFAINW